MTHKIDGLPINSMVIFQPVIDGLPIKNCGSFHGELLNNQRVPIENDPISIVK